MNKEDSISLLEKLRALAKTNFIIDTFIREAEVDVKVNFLPNTPSQEYVDQVIIEKHLGRIVEKVLVFQTAIIENIESQMQK
jgi:hypothetical protein